MASISVRLDPKDYLVCEPLLSGEASEEINREFLEFCNKQNSTVLDASKIHSEEFAYWLVAYKIIPIFYGYAQCKGLSLRDRECPLSRKLIKDPVRDSHGHVFERAFIVLHLQKVREGQIRGACPLGEPGDFGVPDLTDDLYYHTDLMQNFKEALLSEIDDVFFTIIERAEFAINTRRTASIEKWKKIYGIALANKEIDQSKYTSLRRELYSFPYAKKIESVRGNLLDVFVLPTSLQQLAKLLLSESEILEKDAPAAVCLSVTQKPHLRHWAKVMPILREITQSAPWQCAKIDSKFKQQPDLQNKCPITQLYLLDPIKDRLTGQYYERGFIKHYLSKRLPHDSIRLDLVLEDLEEDSNLQTRIHLALVQMKADIEGVLHPFSEKSEKREKTFLALEKNGRNLTKMAREGRLSPVLERDEEIGQAIAILKRSVKNNPILVGTAGSGKTKIARGIALELIKNPAFKDKQLFELEMAKWMSDTQYRGLLEGKVKEIIEEMEKADGDVFLFIDEIHMILHAGESHKGHVGISDLIKPALADGKLHCIGATTKTEYKIIQQDPALERRFERIDVEELSPEAILHILEAKRPKIEEDESVIINGSALSAAAILASFYNPEVGGVDGALKLILAAVALIKVRCPQAGPMPEVNNEEIFAIVAKSTRYPIEEIRIKYEQKAISPQVRLKEKSLDTTVIFSEPILLSKIAQSIFIQDGIQVREGEEFRHWKQAELVLKMISRATEEQCNQIYHILKKTPAFPTYLCPITGACIFDPVTDGTFYYERAYIKKALTTPSYSSKTPPELRLESLQEDAALQTKIHFALVQMGPEINRIFHPTSEETERTFPILEKYGRNLTKMAKEGLLPPVLGRDVEIRQAIAILNRSTKNNPILIGGAGVGKTAIARGIALELIKNPAFKGKQLIELEMAKWMSDTQLRGLLEGKVKEIIEEMRKASGNVFLFIDEIHMILHAGQSSEGHVGISDLIKPALAEGTLHCIGATTGEEFSIIQQDLALERRFEQVDVKELSLEAALQVLKAKRQEIEQSEGILIHDDALSAAVFLASFCNPHAKQPDGTLKLIYAVASELKGLYSSRQHEMNSEVIFMHVAKKMESSIEEIRTIYEQQQGLL